MLNLPHTICSKEALLSIGKPGAATWPFWQLWGAPAYLHLVTPNAFAAGPSHSPATVPPAPHPSLPSQIHHHHHHCGMRAAFVRVPPAPGCALRTCSHAHLSPVFFFLLFIELASPGHVSVSLASRPAASLPLARHVQRTDPCSVSSLLRTTSSIAVMKRAPKAPTHTGTLGG